MSTKGIADVVFCLDTSASMRPCIDGVRAHLGDFLDGLRANRQMNWDLRVDFLAHSAGKSGQGIVSKIRSLYSGQAWWDLYHPSQSARFFTSDQEEFRNGLKQITVAGNEASLIGLDCALDFPWRESNLCHRVVIFLTDEPFETGVLCEEQKAMLPELIKKIQQQRVMLFMVAPNSVVYSDLSAVDRSEYEVVESDNDGLSKVDFQKVMSYIGKSVSASTLQQGAAASVKRALFGQDQWSKGMATLEGR